MTDAEGLKLVYVIFGCFFGLILIGGMVLTLVVLGKRFVETFKDIIHDRI